MRYIIYGIIIILILSGCNSSKQDVTFQIGQKVDGKSDLLINAKDALNDASKMANDWSSDAELFELVGPTMQADGRSYSWLFHFYSESKESYYFLQWSKAGTVKVSETTDRSFNKEYISEMWMDSDEAMNNFKGEFGEPKNQVMGTVLFTDDYEGCKPCWIISSGGYSLTFNANSGEVYDRLDMSSLFEKIQKP